jgi:tRNA dimethylallyltransferase
MTEGFLVVIVGPTAIGKTDVSLELAKALNAEIISADSRQFFKDISIGTAKPTPFELKSVNHHFVDFLELYQEYSAGQFERDVINFLSSHFQTHSSVVMVGGSGLYVKAILDGFDDLPKSPEFRDQLNERFNAHGIKPLVDELLILDPNVTVDLENPQRVIRALEVCLGTNKPYSSYLNKSKSKREFTHLVIGLDGPREWVYDRINQRVDEMLEEGLLEEAESCLHLKGAHALKTVGYVELFEYLEGNCSLGQATEKIKQHTRNFAKRQWTWFKKRQDIVWMDAREPQAIIDYVLSEHHAYLSKIEG